MALYYNGIMVSGINFTPRLTLAEYNALEVKPDYWIRTDVSSSDIDKIPASEISVDLGSGNYSNVQTELEGKVSKSGDTISGELSINPTNGMGLTIDSGTSQVVDSGLRLGSADSRGFLRVYGTNNNFVDILADNLPVPYQLKIPNRSNTTTIATTDVLDWYVRCVSNFGWNWSAESSVTATFKHTNTAILFGGRNNSGLFLIIPINATERVIVNNTMGVTIALSRDTTNQTTTITLSNITSPTGTSGWFQVWAFGGYT